MFSAVTIGILVGLGVAAWVYNKAHERTGGNNKNALILAGVAFLFGFVLAASLFGLIDRLGDSLF